MAGFRIEGNTSGNVAEVDASNNILVTTPGYNAAGEAVGGGDVNGQATFSEVDAGTITGERIVLSPEVDRDYRLRVAHDNLMDEEKFTDTAVSLATADTASFATATTKAPRRIPLGFATWPIGAAIGAQPQNGPITLSFVDGPVIVNPGEFVALVGKFLVGTATASQTISFIWQPIYSWE